MNLTHHDFAALSWHDNKLYAIDFGNSDSSVMIDIDFIIKWIPKEDGAGYNFQVAPANLKFINVFNLIINLDFKDYADIYIDEIKMINKRLAPNNLIYMWDYIIVTDRGEISFTATGFFQKLLAEPHISESQVYNRDIIQWK